MINKIVRPRIGRCEVLLQINHNYDRICERYQLFSSQITIPEGNDNNSENVDKLCSDGMASTALESTHSNTEEPSMETSSFQTDQLEVASVNASYDAQRTPKMPVKRASLRRGQKK